MIQMLGINTFITNLIIFSGDGISRKDGRDIEFMKKAILKD